MTWRNPHDHPAEEANGHPSLLFLVDRIDMKVDQIMGLLGQGHEVMRRLSSESENHATDIKELKRRAEQKQSSNLSEILAAMREVMPLKQWFGGGILVGCALFGIRMPAEIKTFLVGLVGLASGVP